MDRSLIVSHSAADRQVAQGALSRGAARSPEALCRIRARRRTHGDQGSDRGLLQPCWATFFRLCRGLRGPALRSSSSNAASRCCGVLRGSGFVASWDAANVLQPVDLRRRTALRESCSAVSRHPLSAQSSPKRCRRKLATAALHALSPCRAARLARCARAIFQNYCTRL